MRRASGLLFALGAVLFSTSLTFGQGFILPGVGPVNRSMAGTGTAAPLDATGAIHWNPASISGLTQSRADIGVDAIYNRNRVNSGLFIGTPGEISGTTDSDVGVWGLPAIGIVYKPIDSPWTYGLGINTIGGFFTNYAASSTNPLFLPPALGGFGHMYSRLGIVQFAPTLSYEITDRLSFGFAPTFNMADVQVVPFPFQAPNPPGVYPAATGNRNVWGLGVQAGLFYEADSFNLGVSIKSPQWFERVEVNSTDALGFGRELTTQFEYPMILSLGAAYTGIEDVLIAADLRYIDFDSTQLFGEPAQFNPATFALRGLGWESVWMLTVGSQFQLTDRLSFRVGYSFNQNPIPDRLSMFNVLAPAPYQHIATAGFSLQLTEALVASLTYVHAFDHTISGPFIAPPGVAVPASRVAVSQEADAAVFGLSVLF